MDPYKILDIHYNANKEEIKRAYRKLALKFHPDKNTDKNSELKFKEIQTAYEILNNDEIREKYNSINKDDKDALYDLLKEYFVEKIQIPNFDKLYGNIVNYFFDNENQLRNDINNLDVTNIVQKIRNKFNNNNSIDDSPTENKNVDANVDKNIDTNVYGCVKATIADKYNNKYVKILVNRKTKKSDYFLIPLLENEVIFEGCGENYNNIHGDIIISVVIENNTDFKISGNDIFYIHKISIHDFLYGGVLEFNLFGKIITHEFSSLINQIPLIMKENYGMPYFASQENTDSESSASDNDIQKIQRGSLYISLEIKNINDDDFKNKIKNIY
jgi:DnaJ-class molecular chaperone